MHQSTTAPQAWLYRKGQKREATPAYLDPVLLDNRHGLVTNVCVIAATGTAEREVASRHRKYDRLLKITELDFGYRLTVARACRVARGARHFRRTARLEFI